MKNFTHPKTYTIVVRNTDFSYCAFQSARSIFYNNLLLVSVKDKYTSSLWLSRFAIHMEELYIKV